MRFQNWAWNRDRTGPEPISEHWDLIPHDADIIVCHQPCAGILDFQKTIFCLYDSLGCSLLRNKIEQIQPKLFICGHIHESGGKSFMLKNTLYANTATKTMMFKYDELSGKILLMH